MARRKAIEAICTVLLTQPGFKYRDIKKMNSPSNTVRYMVCALGKEWPPSSVTTRTIVKDGLGLSTANFSPRFNTKVASAEVARKPAFLSPVVSKIRPAKTMKVTAAGAGSPKRDIHFITLSSQGLCQV